MDGKQDDQAGDGKEQEQEQQTFSQSDVDRIVADRLNRERAKFADYDDLKKRAAGQKTAEDRITVLEDQLAKTQREALRRRVQAAHSISDEDADLFLTGVDEAALTAQAKRLAARESERKKTNHVPREGANPPPADDEMREFVRKTFARAE